jgi:biopolymer transport protein TolQ
VTHDLSLVGLFLQADPVVKAVMVLLVLVSAGCWGIIFDKGIRLMRLRREAERFGSAVRADVVAQGRTVPGIGARLLPLGLREWNDRSDPGETRAERRDRIERAMRAGLSDELKRVESGIPFLATVGSAAPFVGLFGTVWGIMNSFSAIAASQDTSLAVVAPGIAEALFATALGLVAAIPAVIAYNRLSVSLGRIAHRSNAAISDLGNQLARRRQATPVAEAAQQPWLPAFSLPAARKTGPTVRSRKSTSHPLST